MAANHFSYEVVDAWRQDSKHFHKILEFMLLDLTSLVTHVPTGDGRRIRILRNATTAEVTMEVVT
jgi:hypothetical protein